MKQLTVDVNVLMIGSALGDRSHYESCRTLMVGMQENEQGRLVLDKGGIILEQYQRKMVQGTFGHEWVRQMASQGKTCYVAWGDIDKGTRTKLKEAHFHKEDFKYVRTAAASVSKRLVAHDPDYSPAVRKILKGRLSVVVLEANGAAHFITEGET